MCTSKTVGMRQQGAWSKWDQGVDRNISWDELWHHHRLKFLMQSVYEVLLSPANLFCWGNTKTPSCLLCQSRGSYSWLLFNGCGRKVLLHHDHVVRTTADTLCRTITQSKQATPPHMEHLQHSLWQETSHKNTNGCREASWEQNAAQTQVGA